jgi:hypothetical protein
MTTEIADYSAAPEIGSGGSSVTTVRSIWRTVAERQADDELLSWPPDMFAFTDVVLDRTEAYRFAVSPPAGREWPPASPAAWRESLGTAARQWSDWAGDPFGDPPEPVLREWRVVRDALDMSLDEISSGRSWHVVQALLTLHAIADEASAGVALATADRDEPGASSPAQMRELLGQTGTIARVDPNLLRILPKYRTAPGGITSRSISRYASVTGPRVDYRIHRAATTSPDSAAGQMNVLLLPWPLQVSADDFRPVPESVHERADEPFGFFRFEPSEPFDVSLVDRVVSAALEDSDRIDAVVLPESSVPEQDLARLEAVLSRHHVPMLIAGLRGRPGSEDSVPSNWVHFGVALDGRWQHFRQDKHHRWSLDRSQIMQYHLEEVLDPRVRWWESIDIKRRSVEVIELDSGDTIAALVCEDLAHFDDVVELLRAVGPTLVVAVLLDGPQLASRWVAHYASVLADDPGSAVLTLTSYGMVANAWRPELPPSRVVALWKDNARALHEIKLEPDAQAILIGLQRTPAMRRAADGRLPTHDTTDLRLAEVIQVRAAPVSAARTSRSVSRLRARGSGADLP